MTRTKAPQSTTTRKEVALQSRSTPLADACLMANRSLLLLPARPMLQLRRDEVFEQFAPEATAAHA